MKIEILQLLEGAGAARGLTVIIDVLRAMTVEAVILSNHAADLIPMASVEEALDYRRLHPGTVLIGERGGVKCPGFDFGNSPSAILNADFSGKTVIHTTSAGTQGIAHASGASEILCGSLVCARATADYIRKKAPERVSLVCMGLNARKETVEDTLCAEYIRALLTGGEIDLRRGTEDCRNDDGAKFFRGNEEVFPEADFWFSMEADRYAFAMKVIRGRDGLFHTVRV